MGAYLFWTDPAGDSKILWFDVVTEEQHQLQSDIVEHPVEEGVDITDHIRPKVPVITLATFVSNTPIYDKIEIGASLSRKGHLIGAQDGAVVGVQIDPQFYNPDLVPTPGGLLTAGLKALVSAFTGIKQYKSNVLKFNAEFDNVKEVYEALETARQDSQLFNVVTNARIYSSMGMQDFNMTRSSETGTGATFRLELKQVRLVSTKTVSIPKPAIDAAKAVVNKGTKNTKDTKKSVLEKALNKAESYTNVQILDKEQGIP